MMTNQINKIVKNTLLSTSISLLIASIGSGQELRPTTQHADPIASATARIMDQFFPGRAATETMERRMDTMDRRAEVGEPLPLWGFPVFTMPRFMSTPKRMPALEQTPVTRVPVLRPMEPSGWVSTARAFSGAPQLSQVPQLRAMPQREGAPTAFSSAFTNGSYAIEAIVPTDGGPEKIRLNGTRREIEEQFDALPRKVRRSLAPNLGL